MEKKGAKETVLEGDHQEGAVLIVRGNYGVLPKYVLEDESKRILVEVFVYQATLSDSRHRVLSKKLLENKAVELFPGCDEEYLYEVMIEMAENHLFETANRLAKGLPIFTVEFQSDGTFSIEQE